MATAVQAFPLLYADPVPFGRALLLRFFSAGICRVPQKQQKMLSAGISRAHFLQIKK